MFIVPSEIEKYCKKVADEIHIGIDLKDKDVSFRFVKGKYEEYGNTAVFLSGQEILDLLKINNVLGGMGKVQKILNDNELEQDKKIHDLIYTVIAKYVVQMLNAAMGKDYFPEIKALPKHRATFFRRVERGRS